MAAERVDIDFLKLTDVSSFKIMQLKDDFIAQGAYFIEILLVYVLRVRITPLQSNHFQLVLWRSAGEAM